MNNPQIPKPLMRIGATFSSLLNELSPEEFQQTISSTIERSNSLVTQLSWHRYYETTKARPDQLETLIIHSVLQDAFGSDVGCIRTQSIVHALRGKELPKGIRFTVVCAHLFDTHTEVISVLAEDQQAARAEAERIMSEDMRVVTVLKGDLQPA